MEGFELDDVVGHRLEFHYKDWIQGATKKNNLKKPEGCDNLEIETAKQGDRGGNAIERRLEDGTVCLVKLADLHVGVRYLKGDMVTSDINCDSEYMIDVMPRVGAVILEAYIWVPANEDIYLVLNGAGGHGTDETVTEYTAATKIMNSILVRQVSNLLDTNVLDLGIWTSLQSAMGKRHRLSRGNKEALHDTVMKVWSEVANKEAMCRVYDRLEKNYEIIRKTKGDNKLIKEFRGKSGKIALDALAEMGDNQIKEDIVFGEENVCEMNLDEAVHEYTYQRGAE